MTKSFEEKMPWKKKKKKKFFLAESSKNKTKVFFFIWHVSGSNDRGKKILFSLHILTLWTETSPKMYTYTSSGGGAQPPLPPPEYETS